MTMSKAVLAQLCQIVGSDQVHTDELQKQTYGRDWTRFYEPLPSAVVFPRDTEQVSALVKLANDHGLALVPSGGRTGLSGGAVASKGELVVSFDKMNSIFDFDEVDRSVTVEAGVVTKTLQDYAEDQGLFYPVDFASSGSSQMGGNIATNAGGIKVLRYGLTRHWISGLKVVTGTGEILALNQGLIKNATGYDLRHLFIGSEGTLGFITEASIQLTNNPGDLSVVLLAVPRMTDIISVLKSFRAAVSVTAFEFFSERALQHVIKHSGVSAPFDVPSEYYVLIECEQGDEEVLDVFSACSDAGWVVDGLISQSMQQNDDCWHYREAISESITPFTPYKNDISVRVSKVPAFLQAVEDEVLAQYPDFEVVWFGHIGDGNLHLNILKPADWSLSDFKARCEQVSISVLGIVSQFNGSISAEHGVGLLKKDQLHYSRSEAEIAAMRALKQVFDPNNVMNPGKLI
ncbi:MAG: FAD-binding oxidoreductase [Pseudomonadales bacterium]|nr:FAD-binding oxidoreductase [Pseudomonadales bacterium]